MIRTGNLIPTPYYRESRDFQYFGRVYDIIFNYIKTNVDVMENFPLTESTDSKLIELLVRTLGFNNKRNYRTDDLVKIASIFIEIIKNKGTTKAIEKLISAILNLEGIKKQPSISLNPYNPDDPTLSKIPLLDIYISDDLSNSEIALLEEVLDYILPINLIYNIRSAKRIDAEEGILNIQSYAEQRNFENNSNRTITYSDYSLMQVSQVIGSAGTNMSEESGYEPITGDMMFTRVGLNEESGSESGD